MSKGGTDRHVKIAVNRTANLLRKIFRAHTVRMIASRPLPSEVLLTK